ncbi:hypothetical protein SY83_08060 [Paenibacillus swuensis]|uniref:Glycosyl transferase n=1 Tax=Paenibacillus swuensis TaxID=1178515 RepID=A0A172TGY3_9BACL|nr:DUF6492 family protein [Paenibacillus swuensis]ANE46232.1 hypothetical protein SY83_08060 [Paenibacillus swuensis]
MKIDVFIPAIEKDLGTLPYVIDSLRKYVRHPLGTIYIVSPESSKIRRMCARKSCNFVHEGTVLPISKKDIHYRSARWDRSGWLLQQLLKLSGDRVCTASHYLVIDADTILIRPHTFKSDGKTVFYYRKWSQPEYFRTHRKLMGTSAKAPHSFVAHYMLFERAKVAALKKRIEARHGMPWYRAILRSIDRTQQFGFSEFETYGNVFHAQDPGGIRFRKCLNLSLHRSVASLTASQKKAYAGKYRSLSFHKRKGYSIARKG